MGYTKRQFVEEAYAEIGFTNEFDLTPEDKQRGLLRLDALLATWNAMGIRISYLLPSSPEDSELASEAGTPDSADLAIITNLALAIAPTKGRIPTPETKRVAKSSLETLLVLHTEPPVMDIPSTMPLGSGNRSYPGRNYFPTPDDPVTTGTDGKPLFE